MRANMRANEFFGEMLMESLLVKLIQIAFGLSLFVNALLFIPQAVVLYKKKDASEISLLTFVGFVIMQALAVLHGLVVKDYLLMFGFLLSMLSCGTVASLAIYYRLRPVTSTC